MRNNNIDSKVECLARRCGCTLRKTGNLIQVIKKGIGTVFQDHRINEVERFLNTAPVFMANNATVFGSRIMIDDAYCPRKYGRLTTRP